MMAYRKTPRRLINVLSLFLALLMAFFPGFNSLAAASSGQVTAVAIGYGYDGNGNMVSRIDGNGNRTTFAYDSMNRLVAVDYPGGGEPDVSFTYDANGNRTSITDATGTTEYDYDFYDRLVGIEYPNGNFVLYTYDDVGNITDIQHGNWIALFITGSYTNIHYDFDEDNRISSVRNVFTGDATTYAYDAAGNLLRRTLPNGAYTGYGYDGAGRLVSVEHHKSDGGLICRYEYTLNAVGNRTRVVETTPDGAKITTYTYDALDRLDTVAYPDGRTVDYDYDSFGNRKKMTETISGTTTVREYAYDADSRLLSTTLGGGAPEENFYYDAAGNLVQRVRATDGRQINYAYDYENRLIRYFDGASNVEYIYNGVGERVAKIVNGVRTDFVNDPNRDYVQVLAETDEGGVTKRVYEWGNELINQEDMSGSNRYYYLHDAINGNVRRLIGASQAVVNSYDYDAFGRTTSASEIVANDYQFHGEVQEEETGLVFLRARYVDPVIGRFLTRDPVQGLVSKPETLNTYIFTANNPVNNIDPQGRDWIHREPKSYGRIMADTAVDFTMNKVSDKAWSLARWGEASYGFGSTYYGTTSNAEKVHALGVWGLKGLVTGLSLSTSFKMPYSGRIIDAFDRWTYDLAYSYFSSRNSAGRPGGVALDKSAEVLLDINNITGGAYDPDTGQIILYGREDGSSAALPPMSLDDLAVAFRAVSLGTMPVVSIEDPVVSSPPEWPGREAFTVRYGPFTIDPETGERKVLDVSSKTHFGWVMYDADRHMKSLGLGKDNRDGSAVASGVSGYKNWVDLSFDFWSGGEVQTRFWFNPKEIVVEPSADGKSMELKKAAMQLSTETMFSSAGQVESTPDAEAFAAWFTNNYDAVAEEQLTYDDEGHPHYIFKELKQLAFLVGIVKWVQDNNIPIDLSFLENYTPGYYDSAPDHTPQTTVSGERYMRPYQRTVTITGGVNYCKDLDAGTGGDPNAIAAAAMNARPGETNLSWTFDRGGDDYNAVALSLEKKEKDGGFSYTATDAIFNVNGFIPLVLARHFDSFNISRTPFGWGWQAQPYALEFKGSKTQFNLCSQQWEGYGEIWFIDRSSQAVYNFVPSGMYDRISDPLGIASRFDSDSDILVYRYETADTPGLLFSDNKTGMTMRLADGSLLDFDNGGRLARTGDRNGNIINYAYDADMRPSSIGAPGGRTVSFTYDANHRIIKAALPDGHSVSYNYDASGNLQSAQVDAPSGRLEQYSYDADHRLLAVKDENGDAIESRDYDVFGRVASTSQPGVATPFSRNYSLAEKTSQTTGPESFSQTTQFDDNFDPNNITDSRGNSTEMAYNSSRSLVSETMADGKTMEYFYDYRGNRIASVLPNGRANLTLLDRNNNPIISFHSSVDEDFNKSFDSEHILTDAGMNVHTVGYTDYNYDDRGNLLKITDANGHGKTFGYDAYGNRILSGDARGRQTDYTFDEHSRLTRINNELNHWASYTYDAFDNRTQTATAAGTVDYAFNSKNQLSSVTRGDPGSRRTTAYTYDPKGQLKTVIDPAGIETRYDYDQRGNLIRIVHDGTERFAYEYDGLNRLTKARYSGTAGGGSASIVPLSPSGSEEFKGSITIMWNAAGDWSSGSPDVTIQYSTNGTDWVDIVTLDASTGIYTWAADMLASRNVQLRFVRPGDADFTISYTAAFSVLNGAKYYVNDHDTTGDEYSNTAGRAFKVGTVANGGTVTGMTPDDPVDSIAAIIDNYDLEPGDTIHVDTGTYNISSDIWITEDDSGREDKPVTITGPTKGGTAEIRHTNPADSLAVIVISDNFPDSGADAEYITVQNLKLTGARNGLFLGDARNNLIQYNEIYGNGVDGSPGQAGTGSGIEILGGGANIIANNNCHHNGANGGSGSGPGMDGGPGRGFGISVLDSSSNTIKNNITHSNGGTGGAAGSNNDMPGYSEGAGIYIESSDGNHVLGNTSYNNDAVGVSSGPGHTSKGQSFGIALLETTNSTIERNTVYSNDGAGGDSDSYGGGFGWGVGIYGQGEANLTVLKNIAYDNNGWGGNSWSFDAVYLGDGEGAGILLKECSDAVIKNNLVYDNFGFAWETAWQQLDGWALAYGIGLKSSAGSVIANNTAYRNWGKINRFASDAIVAGQIYVGYNSTDTTVKNNISEAAHDESHAIFVSSSSQSGFVSDHNDFYRIDLAWLGLWGTTRYKLLSDWQAVTTQDANSVSVDPKFYDVTASNFHLSYDSPLIDIGENLTTVQSDGDGETRPADGPDSDLTKTHDIGYDEFIDSDGDKLADVIEVKLTKTDPQETDSDLDGLPDGWEVANGIDPRDSSGLNGWQGDPDGDGYTNAQEFSSGSNPNNAVSIPPAPPRIIGFNPPDANRFILEGDAILFSATATDANGDPITYSWRVDNIVQATTNSWSFITTDESSGMDTLSKEYVVNLVVSAGGDQVGRQWKVVVNNRNRVPVLTPIPNLSVRAGDTIHLDPIYFDPDNQNAIPGDDNALTVEFSGWMSSSTKTVSAEDHGLHTVEVRIQDDGSPPLSARQTVQITVRVPNLLLHQPEGWVDKIVVSDTAGTQTDAAVITVNQSYYIDYAEGNSGNGYAGPSIMRLLIDENIVDTVKRTDNLGIAEEHIRKDFAFIFTSTGWHTIKVVVDAEDSVEETNEGDNSYVRNIYVKPNDTVIIGDINDDGNIDLADLILVLQIVSGITPGGTVQKAADVNGDNRIGIEEALFIGEKIAGIR